MNFDFFTSTLSEIREYRSVIDYWYFLSYYLRQPGAVAQSELIAINEKITFGNHFRSSHITFPADPEGLTLVEKTFGLELPQDFKEFYRQWGQVMLVLREAYWIMPARQIVDTNVRWRDIYGGNQDPCNVVRFARYFDESGQHFGLRRKHPGAEWNVVMVDDRDHPVDDADAGKDEADWRVTDASFTAWLKRILETDGAPWFPGAEEPPCQTERVS